MEANDLRQYTPEELSGRVRQWKEELFRLGFKMQTSEARDTSLYRKLRRDIARAQTVLSEKSRGIVVTSSKPAKTEKPKAKKEASEKKVAASAEDAPEKKEARAAKKPAADKKKKKE